MKPKTASLYETRIRKKLCTRCGGAKVTGETRRKCPSCREQESQWRKNTRVVLKRDAVEQKYRMKTWAKRCLTHSKRSDTKYSRVWDENTYMTERQLKTLRILQENRCVYCSQTMQVVNRRRPNGLTVERIVAGKRAHDGANILLACHQCNCRRVGNSVVRESPLRVYYNLWMAHKNRKRPLTA